MLLILGQGVGSRAASSSCTPVKAPFLCLPPLQMQLSVSSPPLPPLPCSPLVGGTSIGPALQLPPNYLAFSSVRAHRQPHPHPAC